MPQESSPTPPTPAPGTCELTPDTDCESRAIGSQERNSCSAFLHGGPWGTFISLQGVPLCGVSGHPERLAHAADTASQMY